MEAKNTSFIKKDDNQRLHTGPKPKSLDGKKVYFLLSNIKVGKPVITDKREKTTDFTFVLV